MIYAKIKGQLFRSHEKWNKEMLIITKEPNEPFYLRYSTGGDLKRGTLTEIFQWLADNY